MAATTAKSVVDTRVRGKPKDYDGQQDGWQDWSFAMRPYLSCLSETMADLLDAAEKSPEKIDLGPLRDAAKSEARQLSYILALQCNGRALQVVKGVEKNRGFEAWRRMFQRHEPAADGRHLPMMAKIVEPVFPNTIEGWEEALTTWGNDVGRWETSAEERRSLAPSSARPSTGTRRGTSACTLSFKKASSRTTS